MADAIEENTVIGAVVMIKSGGHRMVVSKSTDSDDGNVLLCKWYDPVKDELREIEMLQQEVLVLWHSGMDANQLLGGSGPE